MNTAIISGARGLGFAIPMNAAQNIAEQLIANGKVEHTYLGVQMVELTPQLKQQINSDPNSGLRVDQDQQGVLIVRVVPDSPAARAGLRAGDVIQQLNGQAVAQAEDLQQVVEDSSVGEELRLGLKRNGQDISLSVRTGAYPNQA